MRRHLVHEGDVVGSCFQRRPIVLRPDDGDAVGRSAHSESVRAAGFEHGSTVRNSAAAAAVAAVLLAARTHGQLPSWPKCPHRSRA